MAERGTFVGYSETSKAFRVYLPSLRKTILRRDVRFEEDGAFGKSRGTERGEQSSPQIQVSPQQTTMTEFGATNFGDNGFTGDRATEFRFAGYWSTGFRIRYFRVYYRIIVFSRWG
jgi:hypothetical protein